ncbi:DUF6942 family protein [Thalassomonas actiniarum]|uniref:Uncharacterized protein n=1 Tax=Thalassomonas actiniarum TaxID=485447 RepID=A0AAE9YT78_9GAMM|nr:hypothetical protein [Thalassomonas actiniarum]WDE00004.1 hypothetical protein SG35_004900 [Thalassomonas actiniarum]
MTGLGTANAVLKVYIENIPPLPQYQELSSLTAMKPGEIKTIADLTGNHWRKIFNVYAKLWQQLHPGCAGSWQQFRDEELLQAHSQQALLFSPPDFNCNSNGKDSEHISIIMGRTYAAKTGIAEHCYWLSRDFAINESKKLIVSPYFDYRQLSNIKIEQLAGLIRNFAGKSR